MGEKTPTLIAPTEFSSASPSLTPLDHAVWSKLEVKVCSRSEKNFEAQIFFFDPETVKIVQKCIAYFC